MSCTISQINFW